MRDAEIVEDRDGAFFIIIRGVKDPLCYTYQRRQDAEEQLGGLIKFIQSIEKETAMHCAVMARIAGHENLGNIILREFSLPPPGKI